MNIASRKRVTSVPRPCCRSLCRCRRVLDGRTCNDLPADGGAIVALALGQPPRPPEDYHAE